MGMSKHERLARELAADHGTLERYTPHGEMYSFPGGQRVHLNGHSTDFRAWKNALGDVRRALRAGGVAFEDTEDEESDVETKAPGPDTRVAATRPIGTSGVYITRKKQVIETELVEAVVSVEAILEWLGIRAPENSRISVIAADGSSVAGPFTLKIEGEAVEREEPIS